MKPPLEFYVAYLLIKKFKVVLSKKLKRTLTLILNFFKEKKLDSEFIDAVDVGLGLALLCYRLIQV
jgi:hypothetical protein